MSDPRYPNPYSNPRTPNPLGRPPGLLRTDLPGTRELLTSPRLYETLRTALQTDPNDPNAHALLADLRQHRRAMSGDRVAPGDYLGNSQFPTEPMPFANREQFRPDRAPGTRAHDVMRVAVENLDARDTISALTARMRSHDADSSDSTWNRMGNASERSSSSGREPSLRDSISASVDAVSSNRE